MTALEAIAAREAKVAYDSARRRHERNALIDSRENRPLMALKEATAARRLVRFATSEVVVVKRISDVERDHDNREGAWPG